VQVLLQASAEPSAGIRCSECARNRGFPKIAKLLQQHPPGCIEGFVFYSSSVFKKWRRRYFFLSQSEGIIVINSNCSTPSMLRAPSPRPADAAALVLQARQSCFAQLDNFEGKQCVLKICNVSFVSSSAFLLLVSLIHSELIISIAELLGMQFQVLD
jgi:hypothetical protein